MKRTAEKQLTKDNADNDDENAEQGGFKKADPEALATRVIKGLPRRSLATTVAGPSSQPSSTKSEASVGTTKFGGFGGFSGFGANNLDGKSTFSLPSSNSLSSFAALGATTNATFTANPSDSPSTSTSLPSSSVPSPSSFAIASTSTTTTTSSSNPAEKFYINLRGLNVSFLKAIKELVDKDPFCDLSSVIENYRPLRENIQKEYDSGKAQTQETTSAPLNSSASADSVSMPVPPAQLPTPTPTSQATSAPSSSAFPWPAPASSSTDKPSTSPFVFGAPKPSSGYFVFGGSANGVTSTSGTAAVQAVEEKGSSEEKPSSSSSTTAAQNFFKSPSAPITPGFSSFLTTPSLTTAAASPKPLTIFGSSSTANNNGNIGNPVGFTFGASNKFPTFPSTTSGPSTPDDSSSKSPVEQDATEENGDEGTPQDVEGESNENREESANQDSSNQNQDPSNQNQDLSHQDQNSANLYDQDGAGEENEETLFESKSRAYISLTTEDNRKTWSPVGIGKLKLKKQKEGTKRRLLMRNSSNGKIIINTLVTPGFKITVDGKAISFIVPNESGSADLFKLRVATEAEAKEWVVKISEK